VSPDGWDGQSIHYELAWYCISVVVVWEEAAISRRGRAAIARVRNTCDSMEWLLYVVYTAPGRRWTTAAQ